MAVYTENTMTWCQCDNCTITMFAGFNEQAADVRAYFEKQGWKVSKRVLCDTCAKDPAWVNKYRGSERRGA